MPARTGSARRYNRATAAGADTVACGAGADDASDADPQDTLTACEETPATAGPPDTSIVSSPARATADPTASFAFAATEPVAGFDCSLDRAPFAVCDGTATLTDLADGDHTLQVRAVDLVGKADPDPATYDWTVDTQPPAVAITAKPDLRPTAPPPTSPSPSTSPEGGALTYRRQRNGQAAGTSAAVRYAAPDRETRDVFTVTVSDPAGQRAEATVALRTRWTGERAAHRALEVIRFGSRSRLASGATARIAALRATVSAAVGARVRIEGFARPSANAASVSRARAKTVRRLLLQGVGAAPAIAVVGRGATAPVGSNLTAAAAPATTGSS
jgi:outer membrane protein OmpA-like peptidoglycan-associated protein